MDSELSVLLAAGIGFAHAFEADHLVAVANLVSRRDRIEGAVKDGIYWGLGHTSTIVFIGAAVLLGRASIGAEVFERLEMGVGVMLIALGTWRLRQAYHRRGKAPRARVGRAYGLAYGVGLVHGLAGSGALVASVVAGASDLWQGLRYMLVFGLGSVAGMLSAAGVLSLPFSRQIVNRPKLKLSLVVASAVLCIVYGAYTVARYH